MRLYCLVLSLLVSTLAFASNDFVDIEQDSLSEDYHILADAVHRYHYGGACGFAGAIPEGRTAVEQLLKRNAYAEIIAVLDGRNIEGKIFASVALLELSVSNVLTLEAKVIDKIKDFIESDYTFQRCQGCVLTEPTTMELFKEYRYAQLLEKNDIWLVKKSSAKLRLPSSF